MIRLLTFIILLIFYPLIGENRLTSSTESEFPIRVTLPNDWSRSMDSDNDGIYMYSEHPQGLADILIMCIDCNWCRSKRGFIRVMEKELRKEYGFGQPEEVEENGVLPEDFTWRRYETIYEGKSYITLIAYEKRENKGYILVSNVLRDDNRTFGQLLSILDSISIRN